uniref:MFS domain-containing protein n=1 Tax=Panagrellus redivivus TaxID=6233 RepID=A0A7E4VSJ9_PANRE
MSKHIPLEQNFQQSSPKTVTLTDDELAAELRKPFYNRWTLLLVVTVFAAVFGSSFQSGFHTGCVNPIGLEAASWVNGSSNRMYGTALTKPEVDFQWSLTVGQLNIGGLVGGYISQHASHQFGRRGALLLNNIILFVGVAVMSLARYVDVYQLLPIGRFFVGVCCGLGSAIVPMFVTEIAPITKRGALGSLHQLTFTFSMLVSSIVGLPEFLGNVDYWQLIFAVSCIPGLIQLVILPFCPESPKYSITVRKNVNKATHDLQRLRGYEDVATEMTFLKREAAKSHQIKRVSMLELFRNPIYRFRTIIAIMLMLALQFSGISAVFFFSRTIFTEAGLTGKMPFYATIFMNVLNFGMTIIAAKLMDHRHFGRRVLLLAGLCGMCVCTVMIVVSMCLSTSILPAEVRTFGSYSSVAWVLLFVVFFAMGPGPIPWFFCNEIFPAHAKGTAASVAVMCNWIAGGVVGIFFLPMTNILGHYSFLVFTVTLLWFIFFMYKYLPETKGKTVQEVEQEMGIFDPLEMDLPNVKTSLISKC